MHPSLVKPALFLLTTSLVSTTSALQALTSSPCAAQCGNVLQSTSGDDIVCPDTAYASAAAGTVFQTCISCQLSSTYVDPDTQESDLQWALYNLRYAITCGGLESAFEFDSLSSNATEYAYCTVLEQSLIPKCSACLTQQSSEYYLSNFLTALDAGCLQQPPAGDTISITGSLFSTTAVNITNPTASASASSYTASKNTLTLGAKIGIAEKRRRRRILLQHQQETGYADWRTSHNFTPEGQHGKEPVEEVRSPDGSISAGGFFDSPQSQRPLQPWATPMAQGGRREDESLASAMGEKVYFSPYSSHYSSPVSASEQISNAAREWPIDRKGSLSGMLKSGAGARRDPDPEDGDRIEMVNVPPVLLHPGNGRGRGLTYSSEEDVRLGKAL
ncbi:hypothetical protein B7494_g4906 [Chlorociboria aeruginascens]|nr:hypothetical protein B7494_g4906 [Chlorociboria aeruginascens]